MLLSAVVRNVTGLEADAFAEEALSGPSASRATAGSTSTTDSPMPTAGYTCAGVTS